MDAEPVPIVFGTVIALFVAVFARTGFRQALLGQARFYLNELTLLDQKFKSPRFAPIVIGVPWPTLAWPCFGQVKK